MSWTKTGATHYHAQLGLLDIDRGIKGLVVCDCRDASALGPNTKVLSYVLCDKKRTMQISTFIVWLMFKGDFWRYPSKFLVKHGNPKHFLFWNKIN